MLICLLSLSRLAYPDLPGLRLLALVFFSAALLAGPALADGDPASDVLYLQDVFLPYQAPSKDASGALDSAVTKANASGYRIKVAVIGSKLDLGTAGALFGKPDTYARFLGAEVQFFYQGHLLVVMPGGYGVYYAKHGVSLPVRLLGGLHNPGSSADDLARAAADAVALLAEKDTSKPRYRDVYPPQGQPLPIFGRSGKTLKLEYTVYDDSLKASGLVEVVGQGGAVLLHHVRPFGKANGSIETVRWIPPAAYAKKQVQLCVSAKDGSGNRSKRTCATLRLP
jgi:hypothetical protein